MTSKSASPKTAVIVSAGVAVASMAGVSVLASQAVQPSDTLMGALGRIGALVLAYAPARLAAHMVLSQLGTRAEKGFSSLALTGTGRVLDRVSAGRLAGSLLSTGAIMLLGNAAPGLAVNAADLGQWAGAVLPAAGVLALIVGQEGLENARLKREASQARVKANELGAEIETAPTRKSSMRR